MDRETLREEFEENKDSDQAMRSREGKGEWTREIWWMALEREAAREKEG